MYVCNGTRLQQVFGESNRPVSSEDLLRLKYLDAVIKETLRLYPPVPVITRKIEKEMTLRKFLLPNKCHEHLQYLTYWGEPVACDVLRKILRFTISSRASNGYDNSYNIEESQSQFSASGIKLIPGTGSMINIWAIHRNPRYWGDDAEQFRPERFLDSPLKHPTAFIPFSHGPRNCVGNHSLLLTWHTKGSQGRCYHSWSNIIDRDTELASNFSGESYIEWKICVFKWTKPEQESSAMVSRTWIWSFPHF